MGRSVPGLARLDSTAVAASPMRGFEDITCLRKTNPSACRTDGQGIIDGAQSTHAFSAGQPHLWTHIDDGRSGDRSAASPGKEAVVVGLGGRRGTGDATHTPASPQNGASLTSIKAGFVVGVSLAQTVEEEARCDGRVLRRSETQGGEEEGKDGIDYRTCLPTVPDGTALAQTLKR
ncbi:uncharacterized protein VDAG_09784 [Verticillium dahliae VdLs.17]|uniref:Uncharacterized protein n=1 Tax=Verticillium dahliae (strain VdLs.17 / ATCC MYA-4575 / FGSC 10137) TaxID=498257 RepID=G2XHN0_VERDV|nr:uncharacterized protein VDAG_09784 [Verticillium dahliae VdLs.17]EGY19324.1 hypothetical protein VDAG_09784 [Verticillium dahliae VdLs.17]